MPLTFTSPRVPKYSAEFGITTKVQPPLFGPLEGDPDRGCLWIRLPGRSAHRNRSTLTGLAAWANRSVVVNYLEGPSGGTPHHCRFVEDVGMEIDNEQARAALAAAAGRTGELLRSVEDGSVRAEGLEWTLGEVGAHIAISLSGFTSAVQGQVDLLAPHVPDIESLPKRLAAFTSKTLRLEPERDPAALANIIVRRMEAFLSATADLPASEAVPTPWYGERVRLSLGTATCLLLGEQLVHGYDIANTIKRPWHIAGDDARLVLQAAKSMMPLAVNPEAARGTDASYEMRIRGGPRFVVRVHDGTVTTEPSASHSADCHISADPVALLLLGYGRKSQWWPIVTGKLVAWGRKPWLALKFKSLFFNP